MNKIIWKKNGSTATRHTGHTAITLPWPKRTARIELDPCDPALQAGTFGKYESLKHCRQWASVWQQLWGRRSPQLRLRDSSAPTHSSTHTQTEATQPSFRHPNFGKYDIPWYHNGYVFAALGIGSGMLLLWWLRITYIGITLLQNE